MSVEYENALEGFKNVYERATSLGDDILALVDKESNPEIKAMITEMSNQLYSLAMDAKENAETYNELKEEEGDTEELEADTEDSNDVFGDFEDEDNEEEQDEFGEEELEPETGEEGEEPEGEEET